VEDREHRHIQLKIIIPNGPWLLSVAMTDKYELIECNVVAHASYGLIIESTSGERGYIDTADIGDTPLERKDWPSVGRTITGVAIGYRRDGRLVISARPSDIALVRAAVDIQGTMNEWARLRRADEEYTRAKDSMTTSDDAEVVLRWALSRSRLSPEPGVALRALANAPSSLLLELIDEVVRLVVEDNHSDEARRAIAVMPRVSTPTLLRVLAPMLAESQLNVQEYYRLAELLDNIGADQALDKVINTMLTAEDPNVREAGEALRTQHGKLS
jgi:hypothetical protein